MISLAGLYYAFGKVDLNALGNHLREVNLTYLAVSGGLIVFSIAVRAERWQVLLEPIQHLPVKPLFGSTMVGYFGNGVLPFRMGEFLRAYSIASVTSLSASAAFGSIILERVLDFMGLAGLILFFMLFFPLMEWGGGVVLLVVVATLAGFGLILLLGRTHSGLKRWLEGWTFVQRPRGQRILALLNNIITGLTAIRATNQVGQIVVHTLFLWLIYYAGVFFTVLATGIGLDWIGVGVILISTTLAISVPAAPGYVGTYHAAAIYVLVNVFKTGLTEAQAFAVILHAVGFLPLVTIGSIYFVKGSLRLKDLKDQRLTV